LDEIITWLIELEHLAGEIYRRAASYFNDDEELKIFLERMAEDEAWHFHIMESAAENIRKFSMPVSAVSIDEYTDKKIKYLFQDISDKIDSAALTKIDLLDAIIYAEFSEWNDLFLYVVNSLKHRIKEFTYIASQIQIHKRSVELYFENHGSLNRISTYRKLEPVWKERILIVDDVEAISGFLGMLFNMEGIVDKAANGYDALELLKKNYYKLIITDIDMPVMDGIAFYKAAAKLFPGINQRIIFFTGNLTTERRAFFNFISVDFIEKPAAINIIKEKAIPILLRKDYIKQQN